MVFRIITIIAALILLYCVAEWGRIAWFDHDALTPAAPFLIQADGGGIPVTLVMDYRCGNCAAVYQAFDELKNLRPEFAYVVRPVPYIDDQSELLVRLVMAAGLEGNFAALHDAFAEKGGEFPESFIRETVSLYGMDYDALLARAQSDEISKLVADNIDDALWFGGDSVPSLIIGTQAHHFAPPIEAVSVQTLLPLLAQTR